MKIKTSELTGSALDWAVCKSKAKGEVKAAWFLGDDYVLKYSSEWAIGGPIIEQIKGFELKCWLESKPESRCEAHIHNYDGDWIAFGSTPLIAAMRCYVASKLGDEVDVPEELT